jgi:hypothetical protein
MAVRDRVKQGLKRLLGRFSGEYSAVAPDEIKPFDRNLGEDPNREVVRAQLHRPKGTAKDQPESDES